MLRAGEDEHDADDRLQRGALLKENIRLLRPLAGGGMGCVWVAEHLGLGAPVAVKFLHRKLAGNAEALHRFHREAAAAARIRSPHVVQILDRDVTSFGLPYIVMELLEGETLGARLARDGRLAPEETLSLVQQIARALARAHELGIVHRDIKPENIFLVQDGDETFAKILDFGVAKDLSSNGFLSSGAVVGTPQFMAPEQMAGLAVGPAADVWALGIVAHCCATGRLPFASATFYGMAAAIEKGVQLLPITRFDGDVPAGMDTWLSRALEPDPRRRFANARALLEAIEHDPERARARSRPAPMTASGAVDCDLLPPTVRIEKRRQSRRLRELGEVAAQLALVAFFAMLFVTGFGMRARMIAFSSPPLVTVAGNISTTFEARARTPDGAERATKLEAALPSDDGAQR